jgi:hypothetical protein
MSTRGEAHLEAQLLGQLVQQVERLDLRRRQPRHLGAALRHLDKGARIMAGELAPAHAPDRQRIGAGVGRILLAEAAAPDILV